MNDEKEMELDELDEALVEDSEANEEAVDEVDFTEDKQEEEDVASPTQGKDAYKAQKRKEHEEKEKRIREEIRKEAYLKGIMEATGGVNVYTGEPITDKADVEEYLAMRELDKQGQDPIADYHKRIKEKAKEKNKQTEEEETRRKEIMEFANAYPNVDLDKLLSNQRFVLFAGKRLGKETLKEVYQDFESFTKDYSAEAEMNAEKKVKEKVARAKSSPGSLTGSGGNMTQKSYADMSPQEFEKALLLAKSGALRKT